MKTVDYRNFEVTPEVTGERYQVRFQWLQTAISLRHSDTVDVKFLANGVGKIVAIPHGALHHLCASRRIPLTDELCLRIAAEHLEEALRTGADAEKDLLTLSPGRVEELLGRQLQHTSARRGGQASASSSASADSGSRSSASNTFLQSRHST